ncbi:MAG: phage tail tape measure protein, partial [Trueperaceae bacterium]
MAKSSLTIGDLLYRLGFENEDQFVASLDKVLNQSDKKITQESAKTGKKGGQTAGEAFNKQFKATFSGAALGSFVGTALAQAFSGAVAATTRFVADSLNEYKVYEQGLLQLKLAGETNLAALSKRIHDVARASRVFSATDVSLAVGDLVKAGYDAETAFALVEAGVLGAASEVDAATGKFGDLGTTAGQLGNNLRALGYDTSQASRVMDVLARAAQDSNLDVSDMVDIVSRVGPTAKLAGLEIEDLAAMAAVLSNNGMDASLIGTGLRSVLQSLINPSGQ